MSRLNDLLRQLEAKDASLAKDLRTEYEALADRQAFGLNFERHVPESVELPGRAVRRGDKVHVLPERGRIPTTENVRLWRVLAVNRAAGTATIEDGTIDPSETQEQQLVDLVVVAEFRDPIYPGLVSTGRTERGGDKPFHSVINAENYHALQLLLFAHRASIDCIYIDPPYNTLDNDWKYNNEFVDRQDFYRHSKWLAFMERRLLLAKSLLKPDGVLIVTIDKNEGARLELLLKQVMPEYEISPVHIVHNPRGAQGDNFSFVHETAYFAVPAGQKLIAPRRLSPAEIAEGASNLRNWGGESQRLDAANCFYPILVREGQVVGFGADVTRADDVHPAHNETREDGTIAVWPIDAKGVERKWRYARGTVESIKHLLVVKELSSGVQKGDLEIQIAKEEAKQKTIWSGPSLDASTYGTQMLAQLVPGRPFPFPKSLYAVQECIATVVRDRPTALVLDFFAGSGTTAHAVMRLNAEDGGRRHSVSVTNNEVSVAEQKRMWKAGLRPGDEEWEGWGICRFITQARLQSAVTGHDLVGEPLAGEYRFPRIAPMAAGHEENMEFFDLTYESPLSVTSNRAFARIAPLLWMRAGSSGECLYSLEHGFGVTDTYGVLADLDRTDAFVKELARVQAKGDQVRLVFVVTDEDRLFASVRKALPDHIEVIRLYEAYLRNFEVEAGRTSR